MTYAEEKRIWTDADFDQMGWHDNRIYKIRLTGDLEIDLDYILKWNEPDLEGLPFTFWVAPATLVFKKIENFRFEFDIPFTESFFDCFDIESIERENSKEWTIITRQGTFQFISEGYEQYIREDPSFQFGQTISYLERNGFSLEKVINQHNPNLLREDVIKKRQQDLEHYENVKARCLKKQELEELIKLRDNNEIDTKEYLLKKKEINERLFSYTFFLKGTQFENW
jgi:hypothetical protein